jgi:hypothetical protein
MGNGTEGIERRLQVYFPPATTRFPDPCGGISVIGVGARLSLGV